MYRFARFSTKIQIGFAWERGVSRGWEVVGKMNLSFIEEEK